MEYCLTFGNNCHSNVLQLQSVWFEWQYISPPSQKKALMSKMSLIIFCSPPWLFFFRSPTSYSLNFWGIPRFLISPPPSQQVFVTALLRVKILNLLFFCKIKKNNIWLNGIFNKFWYEKTYYKNMIDPHPLAYIIAIGALLCNCLSYCYCLDQRRSSLS